MNRPGDVMPELTDEFVASISDRYIELYEHITGQPFNRASALAADAGSVADGQSPELVAGGFPAGSSLAARIEKNISTWLATQ